VRRWDCITINNTPVNESVFRKVERHYRDLSERDGIYASPFEILTATAFHVFNEEQIQIGIVEVGMGGKEDATNILNNQAVSVISKIHRDHQNFLGDTLEEIALHKAGILRPEVPYIINPFNEKNVKDVIQDYANIIGAGPRLDHDPPDLRRKLFCKNDWKTFINPLPTAQRNNVILAAIATRHAVQSIGLDFRPFDIGRFLVKSRLSTNPGRLELIRMPLIFGSESSPKGQPILVDGAHNPDAAKSLHEYVRIQLRRGKVPGSGYPGLKGWPVTWVLAMTEGKDAHEYLKVLLEPGDSVITTKFGPVDGMPSVKPMDPKKLLDIAKSVQPGVTGLAMPKEGAMRALCAAKYMTQRGLPVVLTGSLYLVGDLHRERRSRDSKHYWNDREFERDRIMFKAMMKEEENRVKLWLSAHSSDTSNQASGGDEKANGEWNKQISAREKKRAIQEDMEALNREMELLTAEEQRLVYREPWNTEYLSGPTGSTSATSADELEHSTRKQNDKEDRGGEST
jgi:folylpolyglutamate synthase/dihydrofolate synthase